MSFQEGGCIVLSTFFERFVAPGQSFFNAKNVLELCKVTGKAKTNLGKDGSTLSKWTVAVDSHVGPIKQFYTI